jgi:YidC/Oxa1 family membrane protein insertase
MYFGPQNYTELKKSGYKFNKIVDFGFFNIIGVGMLYCLKFFYNLTRNYGLAIIFLTILIRALLWWPTQKSYTSMKKMQTSMNKMQPRLKTLKEVYRDNPQKLNEETMKLYKEYQINPMGGCLPMLLQMPIFFALYATLNSAVELKGAGFFWVWKDLSLKDPIYLLPILMGLSMFFQQKMSTPPAATPEAEAQQKMMLYLMPAMLTFFSFMWPAGLLLYWVVSNMASIVQQLIINRKS